MTKTEHARSAVASGAVFGHASNANMSKPVMRFRSGSRTGSPNRTMGRHDATHAQQKKKRRSAECARGRTPRSSIRGCHDAVTAAVLGIRQPCPRTGRRRAGTRPSFIGFDSPVLGRAVAVLAPAEGCVASTARCGKMHETCNMSSNRKSNTQAGTAIPRSEERR